MSLGPYASFIVTSYALVAAVVLVLIIWIADSIIGASRSGFANSTPAA